MNVEQVWITPNADALIAKIARVSSSNQDNPEYEKLIKYLIKNKHWSPFEMASACYEIQTSRAISQQITRHRSFSYQEFSQRYAKATAYEEIIPRRGGSSWGRLSRCMRIS
jgi:thymidylate synthase (FAD)